LSHERGPRRVQGRFKATGMTTALIAVGAAFLLVGSWSARSAFVDPTAGYQSWSGNYAQVRPWLTWIVGDTTEAGFQKDALAGALMLIGAAAAYRGAVRGQRWAGFALSGGIGLFPWMAGSALLGLLISNVAWGWTIAVSGMWQPTFVPFVSLPSALVLI
jgi:hypothetical protein